MPNVTKQLPNHRVIPAANGSMLSRGIPVEQLEEAQRVTALIYGINRVGKTTLACQFEKPLALVSFEPTPFSGGAVSVTKIPGVTFFMVIPSTAAAKWPKKKALPVVGTDGARVLADELRGSNFKTVVLDGGTSLQDVCLCEIMQLEQLPQQMRVARVKGDDTWGVATSDDYMDRSAKAKEIMRIYLNLPQDVIILCKEKDHNPPRDEKGNVRRDKLTRGLTLESFISADLGQATAGWLSDACNCLCRLYLAEETKIEKFNVAGKVSTREVKTGRSIRRLLTQLHPNFAAGIRSANPDAVPEYIEDQTSQGMYAKLRKVLRGEKIT